MINHTVSTPPAHSGSFLNRETRKFLVGATVTLFALIVLVGYLSPFAYSTSTSLKTKEQISRPKAPIWPAEPATVEYGGETYELYYVPTNSGRQEWALVKKGRQESLFVDPATPEAGPIVWEGKWRTLEPVWEFSAQWENYIRAWNFPGQDFTFGRLLWNTFVIGILGTLGTVLSCSMVAYGFSRFRIPYRDLLFMILISTIFLPRTVITVPTYAFFVYIGWVGTWLPLIVPHFFANAYNVFWLRQYFMTIPREMDEAAMIDGAGPFRILWSIILPQSKPAIVAVVLMHMIFAWKDFFEPLIYLAAKPELQPISVGVQQFNALYGAEPQLIQAAVIIGLALPVLLFFFAQRYFMQGIVTTGVEK
jgi:multiple sugar transport system permease protein